MSKQADTGTKQLLNKATVEALPTPPKGNRVTYYAGVAVQGYIAPRGFGVRVTANGARSFVLNYQLGGRECRYTIGQYPEWSPLDAVKRARELRQRIDKGEDPMADRAAQRAAAAPQPAAPATVADVIEDHIKRHVSALRTARSVENALRRHVLPALGSIPIYDLRRRHIAAMLDTVEERAGPVQASHVVGYLNKAFNWYATRDDEFTSPMIRGMARSKPSERARDRILSDDELRALWPCLDATQPALFGPVCKLALLTASRRGEVAGMRRSEIQDGVWTIPAERYKTKRRHVVPLTAAALEIIAAQPVDPRAPDLVFPSEVATVFSAWDKPKKRLDAASGVRGWTLHDLRRTAKTLMVRAGVRPDISERVLGHALGAIEATYDRHSYLDEKREALEALAGQVDRILHPAPNVVPLRPAAAG